MFFYIFCIASVVKAVNKYGMKNVDENRRDSYFLDISPCSQEASVCTTLEDGLKQLTPVRVTNSYNNIFFLF